MDTKTKLMVCARLCKFIDTHTITLATMRSSNVDVRTGALKKLASEVSSEDLDDVLFVIATITGSSVESIEINEDIIKKFVIGWTENALDDVFVVLKYLGIIDDGLLAKIVWARHGSKLMR